MKKHDDLSTYFLRWVRCSPTRRLRAAAIPGSRVASRACRRFSRASAALTAPIDMVDTLRPQCRPLLILRLPLRPQRPVAALAVAAPALTVGLPRGTVVHVVGGDTLDVDRAGTVERVRLIGIDMPETVKPNTLVECFGRQAPAYAKQLLDGQAVSIEAYPSQDTRDRYGRLLAYIWLDDGRLANLELVAGGYAYESTISPTPTSNTSSRPSRLPRRRCAALVAPTCMAFIGLAARPPLRLRTIRLR